ncbi:hypothetical protein KC353_g4916 [Hortaea werneckii]|nr:hypothetical protein KC353_g4916 [Hortaea werneckii]
MCVAPKLLSKNTADLLGHGYHHGAVFTLYCWLSLFFWPRFDTYCHHKRDGCNLVRSRFYLEELYAIFDYQQPATKLVKPARNDLED